MRRDYRLAAYALAASAAILLASGAAVVAGDAVAGLPGDVQLREDGNATNGDELQADASVVEGDAVAFTVDHAGRACGGGLRVDAPNRTRTDVRVDGATVTLIGDDDGEPFEEIERERFAALVWDEASQRAGLDEYDRVEVRVDQHYETTEREEPSDAAGVTVRPVGECLPTVRGEVDLDDETVAVHSALPEFDDLELTFTDTIGVLGEDETALIEDLVASDERASYNVQRQFDDPDELEATVLEATNDGRVDIELAPPADDGRAVVVTVDLDAEAVVQSWMRVELDERNVVSADDADGNGTISFETNSTDEDA